jgi:hypothetical protein
VKKKTPTKSNPHPLVNRKHGFVETAGACFFWNFIEIKLVTRIVPVQKKFGKI